VIIELFSLGVTVEALPGPFYGRPYGGVGILIKKKLMPFAVNVVTEDRLIAFKVADCLLINVYMPCSDTNNCDDTTICTRYF